MNDLIFILFVLIIAFIIGFFTAYFYYKAKWQVSLLKLQSQNVSNLEKQVAQLEHEKHELIENAQILTDKMNEIGMHEAQTRSQLEKIEKELYVVKEDLAICKESNKEKDLLLAKLQASEKTLLVALEKEKQEKEGLILNIQTAGKVPNAQQDNKKSSEKHKNEPQDKTIPIKADSPKAARVPLTPMFHDASADEKDDLKRISGIGPFIEQKLNELGIFTYRQISQFDTETLRKVAVAIKFFPTRIERENWVEQATALTSEKKAKN